MDDGLYFTDQHIAVRDMVRTFAREEIAPIAARYDAQGEFPWPTVKRMAELGLLGVPWPEELGGAGLDLLSYVTVIYELAKVDASHAITVSAHTTLGTSPIVNFGNAAQRTQFVPLLASGRVLAGFGLTEPSSGSDAAGLKTTAVQKRGGYVLNGSKMFITHGGVGEVFVVAAITQPGVGAKGISAFILTKETADLARARALAIGHDDSVPAMAGFRAGKKEDKLGWRASDTCALLFEDVEVPPENLLGPEGTGFGTFMRTLDSGRIGMAALALGIADGAFEQALQYTAVRRQFGQSISAFQGVQFQLSDMATEIEAGKHLAVSRHLVGATRQAVRDGGIHGQALLQRARHANHHQGRAAARRLRLHQGLPRRADDARCQNLRDRGRNVGNSAHRDRSPPPEGDARLRWSDAVGGAPARSLRHDDRTRHSEGLCAGFRTTVESDETRNIDQRDAARNAGRHTGGRPAR